jgi:hypothetical protein
MPAPPSAPKPSEIKPLPLTIRINEDGSRGGGRKS